MEQIKSIVDIVLKRIEKKQQFFNEENEAIWKQCVKKGVAKHTKVRSFKHSKLHVYVEGPAWLYQLNIEKEQVLKKIKKISKNKIKDIKFTVGDING